MSRLLWIIVLAIWIIFLTWIWWLFTCGPKSVVAADDGCDKISITDGNNLSYNEAGNVKFLRSSSNLILTDGYLDNALATVNNYLIDNPKRAVTITGKYDTHESTAIGMARANEIKEIFLKNGIKNNQVLTRSSSFEPKCTNGDTLYQAASFTFGVAQ